MPQYFIPAELIRDGVFSAGEDESRHITRAARKKAGEKIEVFDGRGNKYSAEIDIRPDGIVSGRIISKLDSPVYRTRLTLCFAPVSKPAAETILEHATEAGVSAFQPMLTSRTQYDWFGTWQEKTARFRQILIAACKQSGRASLPELLSPQKFDDVLSEPGTSLVASPDAPAGFDALSAGLLGVESLKVLIGPEGGFTKGEMEFAAVKKALFFSMGKYTLRAETAALAASVTILNKLG